MIYLFKHDKTIYTDLPIIDESDIKSFPERREIKGSWTISPEIKVEGNYKHVKACEFIGFIDRYDRFQLYRIKNIQVNNDYFIVDALYLFHDEAYAGDIIRDRRFIDGRAHDAAVAAFSGIGWQLSAHDLSDEQTTNFYYLSPLECMERIEDVWGFEFDFWVNFDGQKILSKHFEIRERIGVVTNQIFEYEENIQSISHSEDRDEIYTAVLPRGRGEELETGGYGRSIQIDDEVWSISNGDPLDKPSGQDYLEHPAATAKWGYQTEEGIRPRIRKVDFATIEDTEELIHAGYKWLMEHIRPKSIFRLKIPEGSTLAYGDTVAVMYREIDLTSFMRVEFNIYDYKTGATTVEFGDMDLKQDRRISNINSRIDDIITINDKALDAQRRFNEWFDREVFDMKQHYDQALIDAHAEIDAIDERMSTEIANEIASFETEFNAEVQAAKDLAAQQIADTEQRIDTTINTTRDEMEEDYTQAVTNAREYAEQQAEEKATAVRTDLETVTSGHQSMLDDLQADVMNIDDFLGDISSITLDERLQNINRNFEERIRNVDGNTYNMLRGTRFDESGIWSNQTTVVLMEDEDINYYRLGLGSSFIPFIRYMQENTFEADTSYILSMDYRTEEIPELDFIVVREENGEDTILNDLSEGNPVYELVTNGQWTRLILRFTPIETITGQLFIGTHFDLGDTTRGVIDIRLPYLTSSNNTQWVYHPLDATQSIEEVTRRITNLEDGRNELITRTEWDSESDYIMQTVRDIEETVDTSRNRIQEIEDLEIIQRGSEAIQTIDGFENKVWLNDVANIGANLIPMSANAWEDGSLDENGNESNISRDLRMKDRMPIEPGSTYTLSIDALYIANVSRVEIHQYLYTGGHINYHTIPGRQGQVTFNTWSTAGYIRVVLICREGNFSILAEWFDSSEGRIKIKFEKGDSATPFLNALSRIEQLADSVAIQVQEIDGEYIAQSDITVSPSSVRIGSTEILGDGVLASVLNVSPNAIDMITQKMRLSGDLYVDGEITALAITAIEGNFSNLLASNIDSVSINAGNIMTGTLNAYRLGVNQVLVERLFGYSLFANEVTAKAVDAIEGNFARLFASEISTVNLNASNITTGTMSSARLQVNNALINRLISNSILTSEMRTQSLTAVRGDIADLRTRILTSDVITSDHLKVENALIDKMFATSALISRLTSKTAFISQLRTIDLAAEQVRVGFNGISSNVTINSNGIAIDGGALTVRRPDGAVWVQNGVPRYQLTAQVNQYMSSNVTWTGSNFLTTENSLQNAATIYTIHEGRYLDIHIAANLTSGSASASVVIEVEVSGFGFTGTGSAPITEDIFCYRSDSESRHRVITVDLGVPTYNARQFYVRFGLESGTPSGNNATMRINRAVVRG